MTTKQPRTALLIRCTVAEAEAIRRAAQEERRGISGFVLNALRHRLETHARFSKSAVESNRNPWR